MNTPRKQFYKKTNCLIVIRLSAVTSKWPIEVFNSKASLASLWNDSSKTMKELRNHHVNVFPVCFFEEDSSAEMITIELRCVYLSKRGQRQLGSRMYDCVLGRKHQYVNCFPVEQRWTEKVFETRFILPYSLCSRWIEFVVRTPMTSLSTFPESHLLICQPQQFNKHICQSLWIFIN